MEEKAFKQEPEQRRKMFRTIFASASRLVIPTASRSVTRLVSYDGVSAMRCVCYWQNLGPFNQRNASCIKVFWHPGNVTFSEWDKLMMAERRTAMIAEEIQKQARLLQLRRRFPRSTDLQF